jgi:predicted dehydrogenase
MGQQVKWGIVGLGQIAARFAGNIMARSDARIAAVCSRDPAKAEAFAARCGAEPMDALERLAGSDVDIVYIATPHALHADQAIALLQAGKPVLIEKPIAMSAGEARAIADAAAASGRFAMEAMWTRFVPALAEARRLIAAGAIGSPLQFEGSLGFARAFDPAHRLFDPALGGGALLDLGVYPASLAVSFLGPARDVRSVVRRAENGVDLAASVAIAHGSGVSSLSTSLVGEGANDAIVIGSKGRIALQRPIYAPALLTVTMFETGAAASEAAPLPAPVAAGTRAALKQALRPLRKANPMYRPFAGDGFGHQIDEAHRCLSEGLLESPVMPLADSIAVMDIIDRARAG